VGSAQVLRYAEMSPILGRVGGIVVGAVGVAVADRGVSSQLFHI